MAQIRRAPKASISIVSATCMADLLHNTLTLLASEVVRSYAGQQVMQGAKAGSRGYNGHETDYLVRSTAKVAEKATELATALKAKQARLGLHEVGGARQDSEWIRTYILGGTLWVLLFSIHCSLSSPGHSRFFFRAPPEQDYIGKR